MILYHGSFLEIAKPIWRILVSMWTLGEAFM